jgi:hypothetical protein
VYVDGVDVTASVTGTLNDWGSLNTLQFADYSQTLAIRAADYESGCHNGGCAMACSSERAASIWNMNSEDDRGLFGVASSDDKAYAPAVDAGGRAWYATGYELGTGFGQPLAGIEPTHAADNVVGHDDMCGTSANDKFWSARSAGWLFGVGGSVARAGASESFVGVCRLTFDVHAGAALGFSASPCPWWSARSLAITVS